MKTPRANHRVYIDILRRLTPEQRLLKAFELTDFSRSLFRQGLKRRFPGASDQELEAFERDRIDRCRNNNY